MLSNPRQLYEKKMRRNKLIVWCIVIVVIIMSIAIGVLIDKCPTRQYLSRVFVSGAKIAEKESDTDSSPTKYYVRVTLVNPPETDVKLSEDYSWVEVSNDYYANHNAGDSIGVLVGNYDIYKDKYFGLIQNGGQKFDKNIWGIEDIFDSVDAANETYPKKSFTDNATLNKKAAAGEHYYFILTYDERDMTMEVSADQYNQYNENDTVPCQFDGYGDYIKITSIF